MFLFKNLKIYCAINYDEPTNNLINNFITENSKKYEKLKKLYEYFLEQFERYFLKHLKQFEPLNDCVKLKLGNELDMNNTYRICQ